MKFISHLIAVLVIATLVGVGCKSSSDPVTDASSVAGQTLSDGSKVVNEPPDHIPAGGIRIRPQNPDDPKYKGDPNLQGGG